MGESDLGCSGPIPAMNLHTRYADICQQFFGKFLIHLPRSAGFSELIPVS